jgi:hypothetical protein
MICHMIGHYVLNPSYIASFLQQPYQAGKILECAKFGIDKSRFGNIITVIAARYSCKYRRRVDVDHAKLVNIINLFFKVIQGERP